LSRTKTTDVSEFQLTTGRCEASIEFNREGFKAFGLPKRAIAQPDGGIDAEYPNRHSRGNT